LSGGYGDLSKHKKRGRKTKTSNEIYLGGTGGFEGVAGGKPARMITKGRLGKTHAASKRVV